MNRLKPGSHIHLMGICGTAMGSLAGILHSMGYRVTGSDQNVYPPMSTQLQSLGIQLQEGYRKENLTPKPDLVIVGNVISKGNPEAQALLETDIPYASQPKAMGEFVIDHRQCIAICGTHGKTTTTSMMAVIADECKKDAGFLIGGIPKNYPYSFRAPKGDWFIIEGDEYDTAFFDKVPKFIHYKPKYAVLTSVEFDHADIYADLDAVMKSFEQLVTMLPQDGLLVANGDDENIKKLLPKAKCRVVTYGEKNGDYKFTQRTVLMGRHNFSIVKHSALEAEVAFKQFGPQSAMNALGVYALAREIGWPEYKILQGLADFQGVKRRQEIIGEPNNITIVEDFAHHPTAVEVTVKTMQERFPARKMFLVFEPRSATSRRAVFQKDYERAFSAKNASVLIMKPFDQSKISETDRFSSEDLVEGLKAKKTDAHLFTGVDQIIRHLSDEARPNDVILIMSNGGFDGIYTKLIQALS